MLVRIIIFDSVIIHPPIHFNIDEYKEFYIYKKTVTKIRGLNRYASYKIWFFIGQKEKMAKKIKEDIIIELENLIEDNNDLLKYYEIKDDFKKNIYVYYYKNAWEYERNSDSGGRARELQYEFPQKIIAEKARVYLELIHGMGNIYDFEGSIKFVEVD